jgi:dihydrofolate reductase
MIRAIVAVDPEFAIGREGQVPWYRPADLRFFKATTTGHAVVMGRRTWESLRRPLPGRLNLVLTRHAAELALPPGALAVPSVEHALRVVPFLHGDLFVLGGAQVYQAFAPHIDEWVVTRIPEVARDADTRLPRSVLEGFEKKRSERLEDGVEVEYYRRAG